MKIKVDFWGGQGRWDRNERLTTKAIDGRVPLSLISIRNNSWTEGQVIPTAALESLKEAGITKVSDLSGATASKLKKLKGIGDQWAASLAKLGKIAGDTMQGVGFPFNITVQIPVSLDLTLDQVLSLEPLQLSQSEISKIIEETAIAIVEEAFQQKTDIPSLILKAKEAQLEETLRMREAEIAKLRGLISNLQEEEPTDTP